MRRSTALLSTSLLLAACPWFARAGDAEDYQRSVDQSSRICPGHSRERTVPGVHAIPVGAVRVLQKQGYAVCPDRRLQGDQAVVFYPTFGVFGWNPDRRESVKALGKVVDQLTRSEAFPQQVAVWNAEGKPQKNHVVPQFTPRVPSMLDRGK